jgi:hypothetical protein
LIGAFKIRGGLVYLGAICGSQNRTRPDLDSHRVGLDAIAYRL